MGDTKLDGRGSPRLKLQVVLSILEVSANLTLNIGTAGGSEPESNTWTGMPLVYPVTSRLSLTDLLIPLRRCS